MSARSIVQEFIYLRVEDGHLCYRVEVLDLPDGQDPDDHARTHLGWTTDAPAGAMLHSTSWRADPHSTNIILTWVIAPDPAPDRPSHPILNPTVTQGIDSAHPVPEGLALRDVAAHAARHLAFLSHTDSTIEHAVHVHRNLHDALLAFAPDVAINAHHPQSEH